MTTTELKISEEPLADRGPGSSTRPGCCRRELEARLTWRFAGAMLAQTGVILAAVIGATVAILRMLG